MKARVNEALKRYAMRDASAASVVSRQPDEGMVLLDLERGDDVLRVNWVAYNGGHLLSLRVWQRRPSGELLPTARGISLRPHELLDVHDALGRALPLVQTV